MKCYYCGDEIDSEEIIVTYLISCCGIGYVHKKCEKAMDEYAGYVIKREEIKAKNLNRR